MGFLSRLRFVERGVVPVVGSRVVKFQNSVMSVKPGTSSPHELRLSNGLKDFLWHLEGIGRGHLLDLGPAWQNTISFFIERNFKVYTEDLLAAWRDALGAEEERMRSAPKGAEVQRITPAARAEAFLKENLRYEAESFDGILAWDIFDYLEPQAASKTVERLSDILRTGGVVLAVFHVRRPEKFHRYRVYDKQSVELIPAPQLLPHVRIFQNREILNLFERFQSSRTFVGRDQIREGLFIR